MAAMGPAHRVCVMRLTWLLHNLLGKIAHVSVQNTLELPEQASSPEPDVMLLKWRDDFYAGKRIVPEDVLLIIEVAESSLQYDRKVKTALYAEVGIPEMWIVNLKASVVEVYSQPSKGVYGQQYVVKRSDTLRLPGGLPGAPTVADVLGEEVQWSDEAE